MYLSSSFSLIFPCVFVSLYSGADIAALDLHQTIFTDLPIHHFEAVFRMSESLLSDIGPDGVDGSQVDDFEVSLGSMSSIFTSDKSHNPYYSK